MCDAGHPGREWRFYIQDMIEFGEKALSFTTVWTRTHSLPTHSFTTRPCATSN